MKKTTSLFKTGFTLIELLIVVAIIAILAAIAVPNFLEAQTRAKVARVRADHRTIATGLEVYHIDTNRYPLCNNDNWAFRTKPPGSTGNRMTLERLTTPVSYLTGKASFMDPFKATKYYYGRSLGDEAELPKDTPVLQDIGQLYWYTARNFKDSAIWDQPEAPTVPADWYMLQSAGPDLHYELVWAMVNPMSRDTPLARANIGKVIYDASNGTISRGSIWRAGGVPKGTALSLFYMIEGSK